MSRDDFIDSTPDEFKSIADAWHNSRDASFRTSWEQTRFISYHVLLPNAKKGLRMTDLVKFPWEEKAKAKNKKNLPKRDYFEQLKKKYGN